MTTFDQNFEIPNYVKYIFVFLTIGIFALLGGRYYYLQLKLESKYSLRSENNRIRQVITQPSRGLISDRYGRIIVDNRPANTITIIPNEFEKEPRALELLARILEMNVSDLVQKLKVKGVQRFLPQRVKRNVEMETIVEIQENALFLPGVSRVTEPERAYPSGARLSHVLGYTGEVTPKNLEQDEYYASGDIIGKSGLEYYYEEVLRGKKGVNYLEVDRYGRVVDDIEVESEIPAEKGIDMHLTIDAFLQESAEALLEGKRGAVVMIDPRNGDVLAMLSKPDYDLNKLRYIWSDLQKDEEVPLYNRTTKSLHSPGSTFKPITLIGALESRVIDEYTTFFCPGYYVIGDRIAHCWNHSGHGKVDAFYAIEQSCNIFFFESILKMGMDKFTEISEKFYFGRKTGIDLPGDFSGTVPSEEYYNETFGRSGWSKGVLLNIAIGQGEVGVTPLQLAQYTMMLANGGTYFKPHLLKYYFDHKGEKIVPEVVTEKVDVSKKTMDIVREGMRRVVQGVHGTAKRAKVEGEVVAGKTGTAQNPHGEDHAWFIGFAPFENPEVAMCVLIENGGGGGRNAAPIAGELLKLFFLSKKVDYAQIKLN
ncbi:MAG: penicillin-binding protein 2 [Calditrichaeota bacterium]|nr:MAG: penicillin-binding protein 2 [Calditrichota bacterium]